jgi:hypothetical protein
MEYTLNLVLSYSIVPAFVAALFKYQKVKPVYFPILCCLGLAVLNEVVSSIVINAGYSNALNCNIYYLLEALLLTLQFKSWGFFSGRKRVYYLLLCLLITVWLIENRSVNLLSSFLPYFRMLTGFIVISMSLMHLFHLMVYTRKPISREPDYLFCFGFCVYFLCVLLTEVFITDVAPYSSGFRDLLFRTSIICNVIANTVYLIAILWIPAKPSFTSAS